MPTGIGTSGICGAGFRCEMNGAETGDWFFARPRDPAWPNDLGYHVGYRIAALRYAQETSSDRALPALLRVDDFEAFLRDRRLRSLPRGAREAPLPGLSGIMKATGISDCPDFIGRPDGSRPHAAVRAAVRWPRRLAGSCGSGPRSR